MFTCSSTQSRVLPQQHRIIAVLGASAILALLWVVSGTETFQSTTFGTGLLRISITTTTTSRTTESNKRIIDWDHLYQVATDQRHQLLHNIEVHYGKTHAPQLFVDNHTSRGRLAFQSANQTWGISITRFQRKLMMKLLHAQQQQQQNQTTRFVWSSGGHSAAAGHGNLLNETYTAVMERQIAPLFAALDIDFRARNFGMSAARSAPEIALCTEAIFGMDADVITWDHGITDGNHYWMKRMYANRIGIHPHRPALVELHIGDDPKTKDQRLQVLQQVEARGLTGIYLDPAQFQAMREVIPDMEGLTEEQINATPPFLRHFVCQGFMEKGDPTCADQKWSMETCPERSERVSWHSGWRHHALTGNLLALFLSDMMLDALEKLVTLLKDDKGSSRRYSEESLLEQLQAEENEDYETFFRSTTSEALEAIAPKVDTSVLNMSILHGSPSICHTGRLPAQMRYLGILTESNLTGMDDYDRGIPLLEARKLTNENYTGNNMPLAFDEHDHRKVCVDETVKVDLDYTDFFFNRKGLGWRSITIPNAAERKEYMSGGRKPKGLAVVCFRWARYKGYLQHELRIEAITNGTLKMKVNGLDVVNVTQWFPNDRRYIECTMLLGKDGYFWKANENDQYELQTLVDGHESSFMRITSFVVL